MNLSDKHRLCQEQLEAAFLLALLLEPAQLADVARCAVEVPADMPSVAFPGVTSALKAKGLIRIVGAGPSRRPEAKGSISRTWALISPVIAESHLRDLKRRLGANYPIVTKEHVESARPKTRYSAAKPRRHKPLDGQRVLGFASP